MIVNPKTRVTTNAPPRCASNKAGWQILIPGRRVSQRGAQNQLSQDRHQRDDAQRSNRRAAVFSEARCLLSPAARSEYCQADGNEKEQLSQSRVRRRNGQRQIQS